MTAVGRGPGLVSLAPPNGGKSFAAGRSRATGTLETVAAPDDPARSPCLSAGTGRERPVRPSEPVERSAPVDGRHLVLPDAAAAGRAVGGSPGPAGNRSCRSGGPSGGAVSGLSPPGPGHRGDPARSPTPRRRVTDNRPVDSRRMTACTRRSRPPAAALEARRNGRPALGSPVPRPPSRAPGVRAAAAGPEIAPAAVSAVARGCPRQPSRPASSLAGLTGRAGSVGSRTATARLPVSLARRTVSHGSSPRPVANAGHRACPRR